MYETVSDGAAAGSSSWDYDYISDFTPGDKISILSGSTLDTAIDDISTPNDSILFAKPSAGCSHQYPLIQPTKLYF